MGISRVVIDGRIEKVEAVDPGPPLLHSRYEWSTRYRKNLLLEVLTYAIVLVVTLSIVGVVLYMVIQDVALIVFIIALTTFCFLIAEFWSKGIFGHRVSPGLYQEGLIHPRGFLLPYLEIEDVQVRKGLIPILLPDKIVFHPRYENRLVEYAEWEMEAHIIGEDGLELLRDMLTEVPDEDQ